jgi:potassium channel subfamily T member 1
LIISKPPNPLFLGCFATTCKINKIPKPLCCLELDNKCEHRKNEIYFNKWKNKSIILAADDATNGLFNFIVPLRAKVRSTAHLKPIVLLLKNRPSNEFLDSISSFPLVYWMQGTISNIDILLHAGILNCEALVIVSTEHQNSLEEDPLYDSSNLFSIQNIYRLFPNTKIIAELSRESNIRFLKFRANGTSKDSYPNINYMYRHAFAAGNVFNASMIDTLLYQAYGKSFIIELFRLMIGLSQTDGSGHLTSVNRKYS